MYIHTRTKLTSKKTGNHLLVKESPEHGQRDVEEHHLQHHLHLGNQKFLENKTGRRIMMSKTLVICICIYLYDLSCTYIIFLFGPVHPVLSHRVLRTAMPVAILDSKLQGKERTFKSHRYCTMEVTPHVSKET